MDTLAPRADHLATILELSHLVCSSLDLGVVYDRILHALRDLSDADIVSIMLIDEGGEQLEFVAALGLSDEQLNAPSFRLGEGVAGWVALHGQAVHTAHAGSDPRFVRRYTSEHVTLFVLPLRVRDHTVGVLNLARVNRCELFSPQTVQMVEIFASHAAIAIDNAATATSLRYATTRERVVQLAQQARRRPSDRAPITAMLTDLVTTLGLHAGDFYLPGADLRYTRLATFPITRPQPALWHPAAPDEDRYTQRNPDGQELQVRCELWDGRSGWLVLIAARTPYYWPPTEIQLAEFVAGQIALILAHERLIVQEQRSSALSRTLSQLAAACNAMVGEDRLLDFILEQLANLINYDSSCIFLFYHRYYARMVAGRGFVVDVKDVILDMGPGAISWPVYESRQALYVPDVQQHPAWQRPSPDSHMIRAWIAAPLVVNDQVIGILFIDKWTPYAFNADDVQIAQHFADQVAVAINNQRLLREARERASQLQLLHRISLRLSILHDPETLLGEVTRQIHTTFGYYQVMIGLLEDNVIAVSATCGAINTPAELGSLQRYSISGGITGHVIRTGESFLSNNVATCDFYVAHPQLERTAAELIVPIKGESGLLGIIAIESERTGAFSQDDRYLLEAIASQTGLALEHLRRERELRRSEERLAQSERLRILGELTSGIAHDFNNLLASILGHTQLLLDEPLDGQLHEELRLIERAALDGAASVRRLQSFAQTSRTLPDELVDLNQIVIESLAITRPRWRDSSQQRGVAMSVIHTPGTIPAFAGDGPALRDLVTNLVLNALDAMPQGGALRLRTQLLNPQSSPLARPTVLLEVSDTGIGMAPEVIERIFDPFFTTKGAAGTGMGLTMVYGVVQRHQGQIRVSSEAGAGATFSIYLPIRQITTSRQTIVAPLTETGPRRILIVEDEEAVRRVLARMIMRLGHWVTEAKTGEEAIEILAREHFDLLCTDLGMPGISGWEVITQARLVDQHLRTVLITGWGDQILPEEAYQRGVDAVVAKPFDAARIRQTITELLEQPS
ncbi:MAG: GAF domain-containing protein [Oscillochloridaceae bacterium umkhey_bin13]